MHILPRWPQFLVLGVSAWLTALPARAGEPAPAVPGPAAVTPSGDAPAAAGEAAPATPTAAAPAAPKADSAAVAEHAPVKPADPDVVTLLVAARVAMLGFSTYAVDPSGTRSNGAQQAATRFTVRADIDSGHRLGDWGVQGSAAADLDTGTMAGRTTLIGDKLPSSRMDALVPTQAWAGLFLRDLGALRVGLMSSQWGMGLVANDGGHALDGRRDSWFSFPTTGDRVARAQLILQPLGRSDSTLRGLFAIASVDQVIEDPNAVWDQGDRATQQVLAVRLHAAREKWAGLYYVHRDETFHTATGPSLRVNVIDAAFDWDMRLAGAGLRLQGEGAMIVGETSLAPTPDHPTHDVRQGAAVVRARWDAGTTGLRGEFDGGWFSGDANLDDGKVTGFKANPNFQQGILLFSQVLGYQSGRARLTASNPQVSGYPAQDLDRLATNGAVTSAITAFPKIGYRVCTCLEVYGGALLAWSPTPLVDPFSVRTAGGGTPRNFLGKAPEGNHLGTEVDLGVVATLAPAGWALQLDLRGEYAVLMPGGVLAGLEADKPIHGGRLSLGLSPAVKDRK